MGLCALAAFGFRHYNRKRRKNFENAPFWGKKKKNRAAEEKMGKILAVANQKGGVGKTTTSAALAAGFSMAGKKVLCIDLDPQGNLGFCLGLDTEGGSRPWSG